MKKQVKAKITYLGAYSGITLGSMFVALAVNMFIANYNLSFGGVTGVSIIIQELFGIPLNVTYFLLSFMLLLIGGFKKGMDFFLKTLYATIIISFVFIPFTEGLREIKSNIGIAACSGAILLGLGVGIILRNGGSTSGPDLIAALLIEKAPPNCIMWIIDGLVFSCGIIVFGINNLWALVVLVLTPFVVGIVINFRKDKPKNPPDGDGSTTSDSGKGFSTAYPIGSM